MLRSGLCLFYSDFSWLMFTCIIFIFLVYEILIITFLHAGDSARTKGSIVMIIDAHVPHVPSFIVNWVLGVMAPFAHRQIKKLLRDDYDSPEKPFPKRMAQHPELYDKVRKSVKVGLEKHYGAQNTSLT